jgi:hypothetical protein
VPADSSREWRFAEPRNLAVFVARSVVEIGRPILRVFHEADGDWQFLPGGRVQPNEAMVVALEEVVRIDPAVVEVADLPEGWVATRESPEASWRRDPDPD